MTPSRRPKPGSGISIEVLKRERVDRASKKNAGVVDQDIQTTKGLYGSGNCITQFCGVDGKRAAPLLSISTAKATGFSGALEYVNATAISSRISLRTIAAPIPREPPVTRATRIGDELVSIFYFDEVAKLSAFVLDIIVHNGAKQNSRIKPLKPSMQLQQ
jgi:hypothetical protein